MRPAILHPFVRLLLVLPALVGVWMGYGVFVFGVLYLGDGRWSGAVSVILGAGILVCGVLLLMLAGTGRIPNWALTRKFRGSRNAAG